MLLFLDCEFTGFSDIDLISIGLVSDTSRHEFYAERTDFRREACSEFVRAAVLPLLGQSPGAGCDRGELKSRLWAFFASLPGEIRLDTDSRHDLELLRDALGEGWPPNLVRSIVDLREQVGHTAFDSAVAISARWPEPAVKGDPTGLHDRSRGQRRAGNHDHAAGRRLIDERVEK